jgi:sec-independent protein translocase protein TatA
MPNLGTPELIIIGIIAILLFGNRLPSVMRSLGKGMVEFKKGMKDIQDQVTTAASDEPKSAPRVAHMHEYDEPTAPKFEPPTREPQAVSEEKV